MKRVLAIVPDNIQGPMPIMVREREAAKLLRMGIHRFRDRVHEGVIVPRIEGYERKYLVEELEQYARSLPKDLDAARFKNKEGKE